MRQQLNSGEHFWRGNALLVQIVARQAADAEAAEAQATSRRAVHP